MDLMKTYQENSLPEFNQLNWIFQSLRTSKNTARKMKFHFNFIYKLCSSRNRGNEYSIIHATTLDRARPTDIYAIERDKKISPLCFVNHDFLCFLILPFSSHFEASSIYIRKNFCFVQMIYLSFGALIYSF